jgi:hypothetical protein
LVARVFVQDAASRFTWSETEQPMDRPRPFMYGVRGQDKNRSSVTDAIFEEALHQFFVS